MVLFGREMWEILSKILCEEDGKRLFYVIKLPFPVFTFLKKSFACSFHLFPFKKSDDLAMLHDHLILSQTCSFKVQGCTDAYFLMLMKGKVEVEEKQNKCILLWAQVAK